MSVMKNNVQFLSMVLDSMTDHVSVIDAQGVIQYVNRRWISFGEENSQPNQCSAHWVGVNYIEECDKAAKLGDDFSIKAARGIRRVIAHQQESFYLEYPCHSPEEQRWFMMRVTWFVSGDQEYFVISHQDISKRKKAEDHIRMLAKLDGLTNIPNRRSFNEFLHQEWQVAQRKQHPICLAIFDLDYFKLLNDTYGHQAGDDCLVKFATLLNQFADRPHTQCSRYGGEEFALVMGQTSIERALALIEEFKVALAALKIHHSHNRADRYVTASVGLAQCIPKPLEDETTLIDLADGLLYQAKTNGRNKIESASRTESEPHL